MKKSIMQLFALFPVEIRHFGGKIMVMKQLTKISIACELFEQQVSKSHIAKQLGVHRETVHLWLKGIEDHPLGLVGFMDQYSLSKKGPRTKRQVDPILKRWIWEIRERENDCCGQKIQYFLAKEHQIKPAVSKIYEILKEKYQIKSKWRKNQARGPIPKANQPREVVQMDSLDFGQIFAFTGIDIFTREVDILLAPELTARYGYRFLIQSMRRRFNGFVHLIQTDGGPEFKQEFKLHVGQYCDRHRIARPYRKNEQSYIESFNRSLRKECLGWSRYKISQLNDLTNEVEEYLLRYHYHRPHLGLGMRPPLED